MKQRQSRTSSQWSSAGFCWTVGRSVIRSDSLLAVCRKPLALTALHQPSLILAPCRHQELKKTLFVCFVLLGLAVLDTPGFCIPPCTSVRGFTASNLQRFLQLLLAALQIRDALTWETSSDYFVFGFPFCPQAHEEMTSHLIYYLSEQIPDAFMVTIVSLKSFTTQHDVHVMNDGPVKASDQDGLSSSLCRNVQYCYH